jgi:short-subunit dehydrogenase
MPGRRERRPEVVVVTGASAGVGRAVAHAFARTGAHVALLARDSDGLAAAAAEVEALGGKALPLSVDVASADAVENAANRVEERFGPLDVWVNDAMATILAPVHATTAAEFERATRVTYLGTVHGTMSALSRMRTRDRGMIVQVGSALAYRSIPLQAAYCGAKFAIRGFTDSLRVELLHEGSAVGITMVQLPAVNTPQFEWCLTRMPRHPQPVPPIFQPEVAARAVYWAAHHRRREVWLGHSTLKAIFAAYFAPSVADRYLARAGYDSQQMPDLPVPADRPANLFNPVPRVAATHGRFDDQATARSPQLWLSTHRGALLAGAATSALAAAAAAASRRR